MMPTPKATQPNIDPDSYELLSMTDMYRPKRDADIARAVAVATGQPHEYLPLAKPVECRITRPPTQAELDAHTEKYEQRQKDARPVLEWKSQFTSEQWEFLTEKLKHKQICNYSLAKIRIPETADEVALVMGIQEKDVTGWLAYVDWLIEHDELYAATVVKVVACGLYQRLADAYLSTYQDWDGSVLLKKIEQQRKVTT